MTTHDTWSNNSQRELPEAPLLALLQVGDGIPGGVEIPGHALQPRFPRAVLVMVPIILTNAFHAED